MIYFHIYGNHEDPKGNPLGYTRTTQRSKWMAKARRYEDWKDYVWQSFCKEIKEIPRFDAGIKVSVSCYIEFRNDRRSDPGNVVKGIVDALADRNIKMNGRIIGKEKRLFPNDRCVLERVMDYNYSENPGMLIVINEVA